MFNYSPKYLGRLFKEKTGLSIKAYCNRWKARQAMIILTDTDMSIDRVAAASGFNSEAYFDRVFHKIVGLSPLMYRKTAKQQKSRKD